MRNIKTLNKIAKQIYDYQQELSKDKTRKDIQNKIENIMLSLDFLEMLIVDDIIHNKNF